MNAGISPKFLRAFIREVKNAPLVTAFIHALKAKYVAKAAGKYRLGRGRFPYVLISPDGSYYVAVRGKGKGPTKVWFKEGRVQAFKVNGETKSARPRADQRR